MSDLLESILETLAAEDRRTPVAEGMAAQYVAAVAEVERLTLELDRLEAGTPEHRRASTAKRGAARERDTLARHLGLTEQSQRTSRRKPKPEDWNALADFFAEPADERTPAEHREAWLVDQRARLERASEDAYLRRVAFQNGVSVEEMWRRRSGKTIEQFVEVVGREPK